MRSNDWARAQRKRKELELEALEAGERPPLPACVLELRRRLAAVRQPPPRPQRSPEPERSRELERLERAVRRIELELDRELFPDRGIVL